MEAGKEFSTLRSLVAGLPRGGQVVVCVPDDAWVDALRAKIALWQQASVLPRAVFETSSGPGALALARKSLSALPARNTVVVDAVYSPGSEFLRESAFLEFHSSLATSLKKKESRSLWIIRRSAFSEKALGSLKDEPAIFLDCTTSGPRAYCQCIAARGMYGQSLFSPRVMDLNDPEILLSLAATAGAEALEPFSDMFRLSPEAIVMFDPGASGGMLNPRATELLGYSGEELSALPLSRLVGPQSYRISLRALSGLRRRKKVSGELDLLKKSGRVIPAYFSAAPLGAGRAVVILRDITGERRRAGEIQDAGERTTALEEASPVPQVVFSGRKLVHANAAFRKAFSWIDCTPGEVTLKEFLGKDNAPLVRDLAGADAVSAESAGPVREQVVIRTPEGERRDYALTAVRTGWNGKAGVSLSLSDVTTQNAALHALRESERTFRELCERQSGAVSVHREGTFVYANAACAALFGVAFPADLNGKDLANFAAQRDRKAVASMLGSGTGERKGAPAVEFTIKRADGSATTVASTVADIQFESSPAVLLSHRDLSGERRAEEELRRQGRGEAILESLAHRIHLSLDPAEVLSEALRSAMKWLGFESGGAYRAGDDGTALSLFVNESLDPRVAETLAAQNTREGVTGMVWKTAEPLLLDVNDYPAHIPYKSLFASSGVRSVLYLPLISGESVRGILLLCSTKEPGAPASDAVLCAAIARHAGDALSNALRYESTGTSERTYRTAVESITDVVYECTPDGRFVFLSPRVSRLTGYLPEEIIRAPDLWRTLLHPDDRGDYSRRISNQGEGTEEFELEYRLLPKGKASYRSLRDSVRYSRDGSGKVTRIHGIVSDVSQKAERTGAEAAGAKLREDIFQSVQEGMLVLDGDLRYREWNTGMELISGFARGEVIGKNVFDAGPRFQLADFAGLLNRALAGTPVSSEEVRYVRAGGEDISVLWCRFSPLRDAGGTIGGVVGTVTDVTHRKSLERELRESEETLRNVIDTMGDALMISDLQGKVWEVNREFSALTGHPRSEVIGMMFPYPWLIDEEMSRLVVWLAALREKRFLRDFDMTWKRHDGGEVAISLNTTLLRNASGEPVAMLNIARDISERRGLANDLAAKSRQIEMLNRIISTANSSTEFIRIFDVIAAEVRTMTAFDHMSVSLLAEGGQDLVVHATVGAEGIFPAVGKKVPLQASVSRLSVAEGRGLVIEDIAAHPLLGADLLQAVSGMRSTISIPILLNERILGTFEVSSAQPAAFGLGELTYLQPIADQIGALIDRTLLFQRVSLDSAYIHDLLNSIESVVFTVDRGSVVREVNKAWRDFAVLQGTPQLREESSVIGRRLEEIIPFSSIREEVLAASGRLFEGSLREYLHEFVVGTGEQERIFQLAVTPLEMNDQVNGLAFTYTDITVSKQTEAEIKRRNEELLALNAIASSINSSLNPDEVLGVAAEKIRSLIRADIVLCYLPDEAGERLGLAASRGIGDAHSRLIHSLPVDGSAVGRTVLGRNPIIIRSDLANDPRVSEPGRELFRELGTQSLLTIPLESKDRVLGALVVAFQDRHTFTEQEQGFIALVGNQLASALENAQLYSEVQAQVRRVTLLYEIGKELTGALDTKSVLTIVHDGLQKALQFDSFEYFAAAGKTGGLEVRFHKERGDSGKLSFSPEMPGVRRALAGEPFRGYSPDGGALLAVPVRSKGTIVGIIALGREAGALFADAHLRLVASIANLMEIAIDRAGLYEDTVSKSREIEARNKELDDFTYVVSHDLKEPLITIEGYSKIVLNDYRDVIDEEGKGYLTSIVQSGKRMKGLIDDLLTLSRLGRVTETEESLPIGDVVSEVMRDFEFTLHESRATVNVPPELPTVRYNRIQLGMVFRNLIANAIKFNRSPAPKVDIQVLHGEGGYTVSVQDNGVGIERQHFDKIFVIFQRLQRSEDFRGTGAGLTIVKKIVENHGGRIWVDSVVGEGTKFSFTIPD